MPYIQQPKELLQHSQDTLRRVNQTDINIRHRIIEQSDKADTYKYVHELIATEQFGDPVEDYLPETEEGRERVAEALGDMAMVELESTYFSEGIGESARLNAIDTLLSKVSPIPAE